MLYSIVREAFDGSVMCSRPAVRRQARKVSTVPKASSPCSARARAPGTLSSSQASFVPEKYASAMSPVRSWMTWSKPSALRRSHIGAVRRHCQTMALANGWPVLRSHSNVVSRWLVMPMAAMRLGSMWARAPLRGPWPAGWSRWPQGRAPPIRAGGRAEGTPVGQMRQPRRPRRTGSRARRSCPDRVRGRGRPSCCLSTCADGEVGSRLALRMRDAVCQGHRGGMDAPR